MKSFVWVLLLISSVALAKSPTKPFGGEVKSYGVPTGSGVGCSSMVENFCDALWAPGYEGNIQLGDSGGAATENRVLLGRTSNQTAYSYWLYSQAKLGAEELLPPALLKRLKSHHYFEKLKKNLRSKPLAQMTRADAEENRALYTELAALWDSAIEEGAIDKVNQAHPGFFRLTDEHMPTVESQEFYRAKDELETQANRAIWSHHPRWAIMQALLERIKSELLEIISTQPGLAPQLKSAWLERVRGIELMIPGSDPELLDDHDRHCAATERNAVYWTLRDRLEICGGYILGGDPARTVSHEIAHSLGVHRNEVSHLMASDISSELSSLRDRTCSHQYLPCSEWDTWKSSFLKSLANYKTTPDLDPKYLSCFQSRELKPNPDSSTLDYIAREWVSSNLEDQARRDRMIRLTKPQEILRDGSEHQNPAYFDPCGLFYVNILRDPINPSYTLNTFIVNEYRCQQEAGPDRCKKSPDKCLEESVESARELELKLRDRELATATRFSSIRELERHGYAEDVEEDVADNLGELIYSRYLARMKAATERRASFLSSISSLCDEPSIAKLYPAEARVQKKYDLDPHSEGIDRRRNLLTEPVRGALDCKKDFESATQECDWTKQGWESH